MLSRMIGAMVMVEAAVIVIANNANVCKIMRTNPVNTYFSRSSFTLIELLIVLAVLSILSITVILTINPSEFLKQARDSTRLSDMANINSSLNLFVVDSPDASLGTASTTYISIPDPTATSTAGTQCQGLGLSELPSGWTYHCAATSTYRNTDGTGWVPVNFQSMSFGSTLGTLPIDPINTTTSGNYYTYTPGGSFVLTATPESNKVRTTQANQITGAITAGTDLTLSPLFNSGGLVGYWKFDEGTGASSTDSSGNGNYGSWNGTLGNQWTTGKIGGAGQFNGTDNNISVGGTVNTSLKSSINTTNQVTYSVWIKPAAVSTQAIGWAFYNGIWIDSNSKLVGEFNVGNVREGASTRYLLPSWNTWYHAVFTGDAVNGNWKFYVNGIKVEQGSFSSGTITWPYATFYIGGGSGNFNGAIDDVRLYNRALSAAEIYALYSATK